MKLEKIPKNEENFPQLKLISDAKHLSTVLPAKVYSVAMGFTFRKRVKLGKGAWLNLSKGKPSASVKVGPFTINSKGRVTTRLGNGVTYRSNLGKKSR